MIDYSVMTEKLTGDYKEALKTVELYGIVKNIDTDVQDEMMMNLFDILLSAQEEGKPVEKIVGKDLEAFCAEYYKEYNTKGRFELIPKRIYSLAKMILILEVFEFFCFQDSGNSFLQAETNILPYMSGIVGGFLITYIVELLFTPTLYKWKKRSINLYYGICAVVLIGGIAASSWMASKVSFSIKAYPVILISLVYIVVYLVAGCIYRYKKYGTIKKGKKPGQEYKEFSYSETIKNEFSFNATMKDNIVKELPGELVKKYNRINKKRRKKGNPEMTPNEYQEFLKTETAKLANTKGMRAFYIIFTALAIGFTACHSDIIDTLIFGIILSLIEFFIYKVFKKSNDKIVFYRKEILDNCEKQGCTVVEYVNGMKTEE